MDLFSNLMIMSECLLDNKRTVSFHRAIKNIVSKGDLVLDVGTGSGIMALFAASSGAGRVEALEIDRDVAAFARLNISANGMSPIIEVREIDALKYKSNFIPNVLIMEMLDTCLIAEQQGSVLKNLSKRGIIGRSTKIIPSEYFCALDLVEYDFSFYGFAMPFIIQARNYAANNHVKSKLSRAKVFNRVKFNEDFDLNVNVKVSVPVTKSGNLNAIRLLGKIKLSEGLYLWGTSDLNMPVVVPLDLDKCRYVSVGESISLKISYQMGQGFGGLKIDLL